VPSYSQYKINYDNLYMVPDYLKRKVVSGSQWSRGMRKKGHLRGLRYFAFSNCDKENRYNIQVYIYKDRDFFYP
jgi:hypothetical protein